MSPTISAGGAAGGGGVGCQQWPAISESTDGRTDGRTGEFQRL